ncbi:hypothetical protein BO70DRAFT_364770 [Aspergillus heteromorphus CBS 117.55]|uniref:Uncharacterized protein n=1 Tax=Aspergillus heteromorphus CBS 117.55 TaxID=1448321 RepID=A0A317VF62_9EURO|nr:uncharacterized protein BO70DRAFT_364770 [Aspergillus heteromorphus CBS 117.55]PWY73013.1 hypothetical protein BO70DRAFT_364770 [Aspergillus heteromorphus CBS 117.55]
MSFAIQFESAGVYHVGTPSEQMLVSFEELLGFYAGIIGLLEYGHGWQVTKAVVRRIIGRLRWRPTESPCAVGIDSSGPIYYVICHGEDSIRITAQELDASLFGRVIKKQWDRGLGDPGCVMISASIFRAFIYGLWKNLAYHMRWRKMGSS